MTTLRQGDRSPAVRELQLLLAMTGHDPHGIDGIFGPKTHAALRAWHLTTLPVQASDETVAALRAAPRLAVEVPRVLTPASVVDVRIALLAGYVATFGHEPGPGALPIRVALAQLAVEHGLRPWDATLEQELRRKGLLPPHHLRPAGNGKTIAEAYVYLWTNAPGNRQVAREDRGFAQSGPEAPTVPWCSLSANEGGGALIRKLTSACYAYPNLAEGAAAYWRFLRDHCAAALAAFERGDPAAAAHELKVGAWHYSGSERDYTAGMVDRFRAIE